MIFLEKSCNTLVDPDNGKVNPKDGKYEDKAVYTCNEGYIISGTNTLTCGDQGWTPSTAPSCKGELILDMAL